jgi:hypothetical protein
MAMKKRRIASFRITITVLAHALSRMPITRIQVISITIATAGRLKITGKPSICGAVCHASAACRIDAEMSAPPACTAANPCDAVRGSVVSHAGMWMPKPSSSVTKYADQLTATAMFPTAYSMIRSHPMIHATSSPSVA